MTREERNDKFILDEYRAHGMTPILLPNGRPVSMGLVRKIRTPRPFIEQIQREAAE